MPQILLVDDDEDVLRTWSKGLVMSGLGPVDCAAEGEAGLGRLREARYDVCLLDLGMPGMSGMQVLTAAKQLGLQTPIVIVSGVATREESVQAMKLGAADVWFKPLLPSVTKKVEGFLEIRRQGPHVVAKRLDDLLAQHATTQGLRLEDLCAQLGISASYGKKLFRNGLGTSFGVRLRQYRIAKAKELLKDPKKSIAEVAQESGLGDHRRLDEAFLRAEGMSPTSWRLNR